MKKMYEKIEWTFNTALLLLCFVVLIFNMVMQVYNYALLEDISEIINNDQDDVLCLDVEMECPNKEMCNDCLINIRKCD